MWGGGTFRGLDGEGEDVEGGVLGWKVWGVKIKDWRWVLAHVYHGNIKSVTRM